MLVACWSAKGGSGTTVVAVALAALLGRAGPGALLVDLAGDAPAAAGLPDEPNGAGVLDWLAAPPEVDAGALRRLQVEVSPRVSLLRRGAAPSSGAAGASRLIGALAEDGRAVVIDCGLVPDSPLGTAVAAESTLSLLVVRPCYLALRRAAAAPVRPSAVVVIEEADRSLRPRDVEAILDAPVRAVVPWRGPIARAVDAGFLARRVPLDLARALRGAVAVAVAA